MGLNNEGIFRNINVIYQRSIETNINKEIQHILTGAVGTNYKNVLEIWIKEYFDLTSKSAWTDIRDRRNEKAIEVYENEYKGLVMKKEHIIEQSIKSSELEDDLKKFEKELIHLDKETKKKQIAFELSKQYIDLLKEKSNYEEKILTFNNEIEKYNKIKADLNAKNDSIQNYSEFNDITDEILNSMKNLQELKKELIKKKEELKKIEKEDSQQIKSIVLGINGLILASLIFFVRLKFNKKFLLYISIALCIVSLVYLIFIIIKGIKNKFQYETLIFSKNQTIDELQAKISSVSEEFKIHSDKEINESFLDKYEEYKKISQEIENLKYTLNAVNNVSEYNIKKNEEEKNLISVNADLKELEKNNPGLSTLRKNKESSIQYIQKLKKQLNENSARSEVLKKKIYSLNKELASTATETESIASINYKLEEIESELNKLTLYRKSYKLAVDTLNESIKEYQEEHIGRLSRNISEFYNNITKGMHKKVILNEDFSPLVQNKDNEVIKNLSCGAEEQLYFAVRLALLREINDLTQLPLLLDDPFVNFDKERLEVVKDVLNSILDENQIILFTHIKSYSQWENVHLIEI